MKTGSTLELTSFSFHRKTNGFLSEIHCFPTNSLSAEKSRRWWKAKKVRVYKSWVAEFQELRLSLVLALIGSWETRCCRVLKQFFAGLCPNKSSAAALLFRRWRIATSPLAPRGTFSTTKHDLTHVELKCELCQHLSTWSVLQNASTWTPQNNLIFHYHVCLQRLWKPSLLRCWGSFPGMFS